MIEHRGTFHQRFSIIIRIRWQFCSHANVDKFTINSIDWILDMFNKFALQGDSMKELDMSTARRRPKSPQSLCGTSPHRTMVTHGSQPWWWMIDSHPFSPMSISHPIPQIRLFQTLALKLQGQGHRSSQRARPYIQPSIQLTYFLFVSHQSDSNSWDTDILKFDFEKSKVKVTGEIEGQDHIVHPVSNRRTSFSFHISQTNHSWRYDH